jgi:hypothetical protein
VEDAAGGDGRNVDGGDGGKVNGGWKIAERTSTSRTSTARLIVV